MQTACLINHYQYGEYVGEAVRSALSQTRRVDEIVIVDDGSDPDHLEKAREAAALDDRIRLIEKENGGQLSCFQAGLQESTADIVFFLDADDIWEPHYVQTVCELMQHRGSIDFVASNLRRFYPDGREEVPDKSSRDLGYSVVHSLHALRKGGAMVGGGSSTSCFAFRRSILDKVFPVPNPEAWPISADQALVFGAALAGARKYFIGEPLVRYRVHGANAYYGKTEPDDLAYLKRLEGRRLTEHLRRRLSLPDSLVDIADYEFRTIESPTRTEYGWYRTLVSRAVIPWKRKVRLTAHLFAHYHGLERDGRVMQAYRRLRRLGR